jgi:hypothetical protein
MEAWEMMTHITLPDAARNKLHNLELARMNAEDAVRSAAVRLNNIADQQMRDRLVSERSRQTSRQGEVATLVARINQWLVRLPSDAALELVPAANVELKKGETLSMAIGRTRDEIKVAL